MQKREKLIQTIDRYTDGLIFTIQLKKIVEILSAAKALKRDAKGNLYSDITNMHMIVLDAMQIASRKAFKIVFCS